MMNYHEPINLLKRQRYGSATEYYEQKVIMYSNGKVKQINYRKPIARKKDGFEMQKKEEKNLESLLEIYERKEKNKNILQIIKNNGGTLPKQKNEKKSGELKQIRSDNLTRTRNQLTDYVFEHEKEWKTFITLTFADNVTDIILANKKFANYIRSVKTIFPQLKYIGVPEFQKRGAVHYHILTNIPVDSELIPKRENKSIFNPSTKKITQLEFYDLKYWSYGYSSAFNLNDTDDNFNVGLYICKYLYKDIDSRLYGHKKILKSNNLRKPEIFYLLETNEGYNFMLEWIIKKEYPIDFYEFKPSKPYQIPFTKIETTLSQEDCNIVDALFQLSK